jgi:hypothetical protein
MWDLQRLTAQWASAACYRDRFSVFRIMFNINSRTGNMTHKIIKNVFKCYISLSYFYYCLISFKNFFVRGLCSLRVEMLKMGYDKMN